MRRDKLYLLDVVEGCDKIARYIHGKTRDNILEDELLFDALVRNLQNIGEAIRCVPAETRALRPDIEWTRIVGLRHLLVHQYFVVDDEIVWDLAVNRCPELRVAVAEILDQFPAE